MPANQSSINAFSVAHSAIQATVKATAEWRLANDHVITETMQHNPPKAGDLRMFLEFLEFQKRR